MGVDWRSVFVPDTALLEIVVRGSLIYVGAFLLLRVLLKREAGTLSVTDLIVVVFLADAAQNAMSANYHSVPDGLVLMSVIVLWAYGLDRLAYHFPQFERLLKPPALPLIKDGRMIRQNMRREFITGEELMGQLRLQGIDDIAEVKRAYMESDGRISVIENEAHRHDPPEKVSG
jgi:uncharacterized membrane protein YcaP (DUF421 family)